MNDYRNTIHCLEHQPLLQFLKEIKSGVDGQILLIKFKRYGSDLTRNVP